MCGTRKSIGTVENFGYRHTLAPRTGRPSPKVLAAIKDSDRIHNANLAKLENVALHPDLNESFTKLWVACFSPLNFQQMRAAAGGGASNRPDSKTDLNLWSASDIAQGPHSLSSP